MKLLKAPKLLRIKKREKKEEKENDILPEENHESSPTSSPALEKIQVLTKDIRAHLKEGKITIHSVMTVWVGSPFAAVEAFKMIFDPSGSSPDQEQEEVETKYSCTIFDVLDILQSLKLEDPEAFWQGGKKDTALQNLVPLAKDSVRLSRKLKRMTDTLEKYSLELTKALNLLRNYNNCAVDGPLLKGPKSGSCYRFRKVFRVAWHSVNGHQKKGILLPLAAPEGNTDEGTSTDAAAAAADGPAQEEEAQTPYIHVPHELMMRTPERFKSEMGGQQANKCCNQYNCCCCPYPCCEYYQHRTRLIPSFVFKELPIIDQNCQHQGCNCSECQNEGPPPPCQCQCCCQHQNPENQEASAGACTTACTNPLESQPFDVTETSYLKEYESQKPAILTKAPDQARRNSSGHNIPDKCTQLTSILSSSEDDPSKIQLGTCIDVNCNEQEDLCTKEVVIVRSAVSDFAESEFGTVESEDIEWLDKIRETGQTGHVCADEIERAERLKRQSIFLNCVKYRTEEILKDVRGVLKALRANEAKWVDPLIPTTTTEDLPPPLELSEMIHGVVKHCRELARLRFAPASSKKKHKEPLVVVDNSELDAIAELLEALQGEAAGVHRSFKRFTRMVMADTNFLKQLCLGFSPPPPPPTALASEEADEKNKAKHVPVFIRIARANEARENPTESPTMEDTNKNTTMPFNFQEIFHD